MSSNSQYNDRPTVEMNPIAHEIAPLGDIWECCGCDEIFYTQDAADKHEKANMTLR